MFNFFTYRWVFTKSSVCICLQTENAVQSLPKRQNLIYEPWFICFVYMYLSFVIMLHVCILSWLDYPFISAALYHVCCEFTHPCMRELCMYVGMDMSHQMYETRIWWDSVEVTDRFKVGSGKPTEVSWLPGLLALWNVICTHSVYFNGQMEFSTQGFYDFI